MKPQTEIDELLKAGWSPRTKTIKNKKYVTLRKGKKEIGMGKYKKALWDSVNKEIEQDDVAGTVATPASDSTTAEKVFDALNDGEDPKCLVKKLKLQPETVIKLYKQWLELKNLKKKDLKGWYFNISDVPCPNCGKSHGEQYTMDEFIDSIESGKEYREDIECCWCKEIKFSISIMSP